MKLELSDDEFKQARKIESDLRYEVSFYDIIHMILAKKSRSVLITRDRKLIAAAGQYGITAKRPEELESL